jgi:GMP synthase (glutamine-hydrolysing)
MPPVLILQHLSADGPAYLASWLARQGVAAEVRNTEAGQPFPADLSGHSALAILGGEMSANDPLPSLRQAEALFLDALRRGVPTLGHCLGGQLMARALGQRITASPAPEVGWQPLQIAPSAAAQAWFGDAPQATVYQWHFEAFGLPEGAQPLAGSAACAHQAFAIGPHLALQFHLEIDAEKLLRWSEDQGQRYREALAAHPGSVQSGAAMRDGIGRHLAAHQGLADRVYGRWLAATAGR